MGHPMLAVIVGHRPGLVPNVDELRYSPPTAIPHIREMPRSEYLSAGPTGMLQVHRTSAAPMVPQLGPPARTRARSSAVPTPPNTATRLHPKGLQSPQ